jgi:hypothetical protein
MSMEAVYGITTHPGYFGHFTRQEAPGAIRNGTRILKRGTKPNDPHPDGTPGTVLGSIGDHLRGFGYFIEWDPRPKYAVFIEGTRIEPV